MHNTQKDAQLERLGEHVTWIINTNPLFAFLLGKSYLGSRTECHFSASDTVDVSIRTVGVLTRGLGKDSASKRASLLCDVDFSFSPERAKSILSNFQVNVINSFWTSSHGSLIFSTVHR